MRAVQNFRLRADATTEYTGSAAGVSEAPQAQAFPCHPFCSSLFSLSTLLTFDNSLECLCSRQIVQPRNPSLTIVKLGFRYCRV